MASECCDKVGGFHLGLGAHACVRASSCVLAGGGGHEELGVRKHVRGVAAGSLATATAEVRTARTCQHGDEEVEEQDGRDNLLGLGYTAGCKWQCVGVLGCLGALAVMGGGNVHCWEGRLQGGG